MDILEVLHYLKLIWYEWYIMKAILSDDSEAKSVLWESVLVF